MVTTDDVTWHYVCVIQMLILGKKYCKD